MKLLNRVLAVLEALVELWDRLQEYRREKKVDEAFETKDQRPIEETVGAVAPGAPALLRDGVRERSKRNRS